MRWRKPVQSDPSIGEPKLGCELCVTLTLQVGSGGFQPRTSGKNLTWACGAMPWGR